MCKFCWLNEDSDENPLMTPCKCAGGVGFIHFECLKQWMKTKVNEKKTSSTTTQHWKKFACELCHESYPYAFKIGDGT